MQLTVFFHAPSEVAVPVHYGAQLQSLIYRQMQNPALRRYLHEHGFPLEKRRFKLFTFSRLTGRSACFFPGLRLLRAGNIVTGYQ